MWLLELIFFVGLAVIGIIVLILLLTISGAFLAAFFGRAADCARTAIWWAPQHSRYCPFCCFTPSSSLSEYLLSAPSCGVYSVRYVASGQER